MSKGEIPLAVCVECASRGRGRGRELAEVVTTVVQIGDDGG